MRRLVAAVLLAVIACLTAADAVCCPDGCRREQQPSTEHHERTSSDGACVFCLGGADSSIAVVPLPSVTFGVGVAVSIPLVADDALRARLDHPPRG